MEEKIIGFWNLLMKKMLEREQELGEMDCHPEGVDRVIKGDARKSPSDRVPSRLDKDFAKTFFSARQFEKGAVRIYTQEERMLLSSDALSFLQKILWLGIIDMEMHEAIIEKAGMYSDGMVDMDEMKIFVSMVFSESGCSDWYRDLIFAFDEGSNNKKVH